MPVEETAVLNITCDNPNCPGHPDLDPAVRTGWIFVSHEEYGQPTAQHVFGSYDCLGATSNTKNDVGISLLAPEPALAVAAIEEEG